MRMLRLAIQNKILGLILNQSEKIILRPSLRSRLKYQIYIFKREKVRFQLKQQGSKVSPHIRICTGRRKTRAKTK